jgi:hypothetical protein
MKNMDMKIPVTGKLDTTSENKKTARHILCEALNVMAREEGWLSEGEKEVAKAILEAWNGKEIEL